jgi:hypothetical protein
MKLTDASEKLGNRAAIGWWSAWLFIFALASVVPWFHWRYDVAGIIEAQRPAIGLLPAHWLLFRWSGEIASYVLALVLICGGVAWRRPKHRPTAILVAALAALASAVGAALVASGLSIEAIQMEGHRISVE